MQIAITYIVKIDKYLDFFISKNPSFISDKILLFSSFLSGFGILTIAILPIPNIAPIMSKNIISGNGIVPNKTPANIGAIIKVAEFII